MISQELFDETLLESQEVFDYSDNDEAVRETIRELQSQNKDSRLDHLSLTHPESKEGQIDRENQRSFLQALKEGDLSLAMAIVINANATTRKEESNTMAMFSSLVLQQGFLSLDSELMKRLDCPEDGTNSSEEHELEADELIQFIIALLPDDKANSSISQQKQQKQQHPLIRELKLQLGRTLLQDRWFPLFEKYSLLRLALISLARSCCNGCEPNKKTLVQAGIRFQASISDENIDIPPIENVAEDEPITATTSSTHRSISGIELWVECLPKDLHSNSNELMTTELCRLFAMLGKFQATAEPVPTSSEQAPVISSAHANVKELFKCEILPKLLDLANECLQIHPTMSERKKGEREALLCQILSALRVMAIDNEIVQGMVALGILDTLNTSSVPAQVENLETSNDRTLLVHQAATAAVTLGLLRNLCANDEIKATLCRQSLASILQAMELHHTHSTVQEHGCGILAAMSLRNPQNAAIICEATRGAEPIIQAMKAFPNRVTLQRQGCLALRNMASRASPEDKQKLLDAGSEFVLRDIAGRHQDSIDEAYAALRDLGCAAVKFTVNQETGKAQGTQMFGQVQSNFRPVYD